MSEMEIYLAALSRSKTKSKASTRMRYSSAGIFGSDKRSGSSEGKHIPQKKRKRFEYLKIVLDRNYSHMSTEQTETAPETSQTPTVQNETEVIKNTSVAPEEAATTEKPVEGTDTPKDAIPAASAEPAPQDITPTVHPTESDAPVELGLVRLTEVDHIPPLSSSPPIVAGSSELGSDPLMGEENRPEPQLDISDALNYLDAVKLQFGESPSTYSSFLDIMREFKSHSIDTNVVISRVSALFQGHPQLIEAFNTFLPAGYKIECSREEGQSDLITVTTPSGKVLQGTTGSTIGPASTGHYFQDTTNIILPPPPSLTPHVSSALSSPTPLQADIQINGQTSPDQPPITHAIDFVNRIKHRYADEPEVYRKFLDVLQGYQIGGSGLEAVHREVTVLFQHQAPDLLEEFRVFLPNQGNQNEGALMGLAAAGGAGDKEKRKRTTALDGQKRKRKASEKEVRERELAPKLTPGSSKPKKAKHHHKENLSPAMHSRTYIQTDEHIFFDRVRRYLDSRDTYDEFLKLLNFFTHDMIDGRTLHEHAMNFLGDSELLAKFREIIGLEGKDPFPELSVANVRVGWDKNMKSLTNMGYKTAYKKLPDNRHMPTCSGRDALCKSVLNDEFVLAPDINADDGGFIGHKKNAYEEALHRTEEERHEYDFYLEAIARTITMLEPINNKISQIGSHEERGAFKLKANLGGVLKSIHQRVLKKIYGREAGMEVLAAMQDIPSTAIPVVLQRLRQKEEEWKRSQREWNKIWREVDKRNYYKSLDHQGITFKANDKKMIGGKHFISQIEAARDAELFKRASFVDASFRRTRPNHQLEYVIESIPVLQDAVKLCLSYLDRVQGQYHAHERRKIEEFLRTFPPTLLGLDLSEFEAGLASTGDEGDSVNQEDIIMDENEDASIRSRTRRGVNGAAMEKDLRKKLLKSEQAKSSKSKADGTRSPRSNSRHQSPARSDTMLQDSQSPYSTRLNGRSGKGNRSSVRNPIFFCNSTVYVFYRQLLLLYSRLYTAKQLAAAAVTQQSSGGGHELRLGEDVPPGLVDTQNPAAHFYAHLMHSFEQLFDNDIDQSVFEDITRYMFGVKAYPLFTADKLIAAILKQILLILTESKSQDICGQFLRERENSQMGTYEATELYRQTVVKQLDVDENVYRVDYVTDESRVTFCLLGKDENVFDDTELLNEYWRAYLDSYTTNEQTDGVRRDLIRHPCLPRNMPKPTPTELPPTFSGSSQLEIRVCTRTYRLFYVPDTAESLVNGCTTENLTKALAKVSAVKAKQKKWLEDFNKAEGALPKSTTAKPSVSDVQPPAALLSLS